MIPWDDLEDQGPVPVEPVRKKAPSERTMKAQVKIDIARRANPRGCGRKRQYPDQPKAEAVALKALLKRPLSPKLRPYACPTCGLWHLTHQTK